MKMIFFKLLSSNDAIITLKSKIKSSLYSPYYAEACNELRGPSPRLSAWATQLRRNVATAVSRWRHCVDLTSPGIEPQTSRTDSVRFATELTADLQKSILAPYFTTLRKISKATYCFYLSLKSRGSPNHEACA